MPTLPSQPRAPLSWPVSKAANGATGERTECSMSARPYPKPPEIQKPVQGVAYGMGAAIGAFAAMSAARAGAVNAATAARASSAFFISNLRSARSQDGVEIQENLKECSRTI